MKKIHIKLFTALLAVILVAGITIFYACKKDSEIVNNLKKETGFIAKNYDGTCVQVDVFRDKNNNAKFVIKDIASDSTIEIRLIVSDALNIKPQQTKDEESLVYEIPNDAIYWLVPFDGNEPVKFEPINNAKSLPGGSVTYRCDCWEWTGPGSGSCKLEGTNCKAGGNCTDCRKTTASIKFSNSGDSTSNVFVGTTYLLKSDVIEINGTIYE